MNYTIVEKPVLDEAKIYKKNIKIPSIRETYFGTNILTDDGLLYVAISETIYHKYSLFDNDESNVNFSDIQFDICGAETTHPNYESTHRLVLNKNKETNQYYATLIEMGKYDKYYYSLDIDYLNINGNILPINENGYFESTQKLTDTKVSDFYLNFNKFMYANIQTSNKADNLFIKVNDADSIKIDFNKKYYYIDNKTTIPNDDLGSDVINYNKIQIFGDATSSDEIILEVY